MVEVPAFWVGASLADAGEVLARFAEGRGHGGDWRDLFEGVTLDEVLAETGARLGPARVARWRAARPALTIQQAVYRGTAEYPQRLGQVRDAPPVLFVQGALGALSGALSVAIVGTRSCSPYGATVAQQLARGVAEAGGVVVSGLARGIDAHAHRSALQVGRTVAVLGHGLGLTSPSSNVRLRRALLDAGGAVVSSWPDVVAPTKFTFPRRNRWIAGLSDAVCVTQAGARSGAGITARDALGLGIDVHVLPGPIHDGFEGCAALLNQGARAIVSVHATLEELVGTSVPMATAWFQALLDGAGVEGLARLRGWTVARTLVELGELEAQGVVVRLPGGRYGPGQGSVPHAHVD